MAEQQISKLSVLLLMNTENFEMELSEVQRKMRASGRAMANIGRDLSIAISVPLALAGKAIVETATEFEYQMARVQAISGSSALSFKMLQRNAEELGATTIYTATSVAQLQEEFAKLGFTASEITAVTDSTLSLAQVTGAELGRAAEVAGSTLRTFGLDVTEMGRVNDIVATAISRSALDFESFAETMKYAGSEAAINGVSMEELAAAMGVLANRGVKGSIAGTRLRMIFSKLAKEGGDVHQKFLDLINGSTTMTEAIQRFGVRAAAAVPVLQQNREEFFALETSMVQSTGTLDAMQKVMDDTSFAVQKRMISALENLSIQFGKVLLPVVNYVLEKFISLISFVAAMPGPLKAMAVGVGIVAVALPPVIFLVGMLRVRMVEVMQLAPRFAAALKAMTGVWGIVISALVSVGAWFYSTTQKGERYISMQQKMAEASATAGEAAGKILQPLRRLVTEYGNQNTTLERRKEILRELKRAQPDYFGDLDAESTSIETLKGKYEALSQAIINNAKAKAFAGKIKEVQQEQARLIGAQVDAEIELEDIKKRAAEGEEGYAPFEGTAFSEERGSYKVTLDPKYERKMRLQYEIDESQKALTELDTQLKAFLAKAEEYGVTYEEIFGKGGGGGGGGAGEGTSDQAKAMAKLTKSLKVIYEMQTKMGETPMEATGKRLRAFTTAYKELIEAGVEGEDVAANLEMVGRILAKLRGEFGGMEKDAKDIEAFRKSIEALNKTLTNIAATSKRITDDANIEELRLQLQSLQGEYRKLGKQIAAMESEAEPNTYVLDRLKGKYDDLGTSIAQTSVQLAKLVTKQKLATDGSLALGSAMGEAIANGENVGRAAFKSTMQTLSALTREIYLLWAKSVLTDPSSTTNPYAKLALFGVGAGVISGYLNNIPALAAGGIAVGPQLAVVGDNRSGREAIIPLEKLPGLMQKMGGVGGGRLYGTIEGYDLVLTNERNNRFLQRQTR